MSVHPETISPRTAGDMYFDHPIHRQRLDCITRVKMVIDGIAVKVVQIEQKITTAFLGECSEEPVLISDLRIGGKIGEIVGWIFQQEWNVVALQDV